MKDYFSTSKLGIAMFRFSTHSLVSWTLPLVSWTLLVTIALASVVPAEGACDVKGGQCGSKQCCGACCTEADAAEKSCCEAATPSRVCRCSAENDRPATPLERRSSGERENARLGESLAAAIFVDDDNQTQRTEDVSLFSFLPSPCRQAVLCRWLI